MAGFWERQWENTKDFGSDLGTGTLNVLTLGKYGEGLSAERSAKAQMTAQQQAMTEAQRAKEEVMGIYNPYSQVGQSAMKQMQGFDFGRVPEDFQFDKTVQDYINPNLDYMINQSNRGLEQSAINQGGAMSGATLKALQANTGAMANQAYQQGQDEYNRQYGNAYDQYLNKIKMDRDLIGQRYGHLGNLMQLGQVGDQGRASAIMGQSNTQQAGLQNLGALQGVKSNAQLSALSSLPQTYIDLAIKGATAYATGGASLATPQGQPKV